MDDEHDLPRDRPSWFTPWRWDMERYIEIVVLTLGVFCGGFILDSIFLKCGQPPWCQLAFMKTVESYAEMGRWFGPLLRPISP